MQAKSGKYLVVVTIVEGRGFPRRNGASAYVQCRFNTQSLSTDPCNLGDHGSPIWDTEVAWDLDARAFHYLKTQRVPIKVTVFAVSAQGSRQTVLGQLVLNLRAAEPFPAKETWVTLHRPASAAHGSAAWLNLQNARPELKVSFAAGPEDSEAKLIADGPQAHFHVTAVPDAIEGRHNRQASTSPHSRRGSSPRRPHPSEPPSLLLQADGSYRVGEQAEKLYRLSVTILGLRDLHLLSCLPNSRIGELGPSKGYYILLRLFGNELRTQSFTDPKKPEFPEESISVDLVSSEHDLISYLRSVDRLPIYLCHDEQVLGEASLDFMRLINEGTARGELISNPSSLPSRGEQVEWLLDISEDLSQMPFTIKDHPKLIARAAITELPTTDCMDDTFRKESAVVETTAEAPTYALSPSSGSALQAERVTSLSREPPKPFDRIPTQPVVQTEPPTSMSFLPSDSASTLSHRFRYTINICSLRNFQSHLPSPNIFFKYVYPPFGTRASFVSHPPVPLERGAFETTILTGASAYEFVMAPQQLRVYLSAMPLEISMFHKDESGHDVQLGLAVVLLGKVLDSEALQSGHTHGWPCRSCDQWISICASGDGSQGTGFIRVAELKVALSLEDLVQLGKGPEKRTAEPQADYVPSSRPLPSASEAKAESLDVAQLEPALATLGSTEAPQSTANHENRPYLPYRWPGVTSGISQGQGPVAPAAAPAINVDTYAARPPAWPMSIPSVPRSEPNPEYHPPAPPIHRPLLPEQELWENARYEVEQWRRQQIQRLDAEVEERNAAALKKLDGKLREREESLQKRVTDFRQLESELERVLSEMERREQNLAREEQKLLEQRLESDRLFEDKCKRADDISQRMEARLAQQQELHGERVAAFEREKAYLLAERKEWEDKYRRIDAAFQEYKNMMTNRPEANDIKQAHAEIADLKNRISQTERKAALYKKQRTHFKEQWLKTLADYAQFKKEVDKERLRVQYPPGTSLISQPPLGAEGNTTISIKSPSVQASLPPTSNHADDEVKRLRIELEEVKLAQEAFRKSFLATNGVATTPTASVPPPKGADLKETPAPAASSEHFHQLERLVQERDVLLKSGVYTSDDYLIKEMNSRINHLSRSCGPFA